MILQVEPVGSFERKSADVAEIEALAKLTREMEVQLDIYIRAAFERLVDLAGTREFLQPFCTFQQYLFAIKRKREEQLGLPYGPDGEWTVTPLPATVSMPTVVDPLFILDLLRVSYQQKPVHKASTPVPVAPTSPLLRITALNANEDSTLESNQQVFVKFMKRTHSTADTLASESMSDLHSGSQQMDTSEDASNALNLLEKAYVTCQAELLARIARGEYGPRNEQPETNSLPPVPTPVFFAPILGMQMTSETIGSPTKPIGFKPIITSLDTNPQHLPSPVSPAAPFELPAQTPLIVARVAALSENPSFYSSSAPIPDSMQQAQFFDANLQQFLRTQQQQQNIGLVGLRQTVAYS